MKKKLLLAPLFIGLSLFSCARGGESITFTARLISRKPVQEEKSFKYKDHTFTYYNVYNDGKGNFVMADNSSYIRNTDIAFGMRTKSQYVYRYTEEGTGERLEWSSYYQDETYCDYSIRKGGFEIRGGDITSTEPHSNVNIGKIIHWC